MKNSPDKTASGRYIVIPAAIQADAATMQRSFYSTRSGFIPGSKSSGAATDIFIKAAFMAKKLGVDPATYASKMVRRAFEKGFPVFPQILISEKLYLDVDGSEAPADVGVRYRVQLDKFKALRGSFTVEQLLHDQSLGFSPLFRYALAVLHRQVDVQAETAAMARLELLAYPRAREIFTDQLGSL